MRLLLVTAALHVAGCYKPSAEDACKVLCPAGECPEGAQCMAGRCVPSGGTCPDVTSDGMTIDAFEAKDVFVSPDVAADAAGTMTCAPALANQEGTYRTGQSLTMNRMKTRAALLTFDTTTQAWVVSVGDGPNVDTTPPSFVERIGPGALIMELGYPRMTPDGNTIVMTAHTDSMQYPVFSNRMASGQWSAPRPLQLEDMDGDPKTVTSGLVLGTPTEASPRRMPISFDTANFYEYEEVAQDTWRERLWISAASLGVTLIREPNFTPDGLRVVFVGQKTATPVGIYSSTRAMIGMPWQPAVQIFDDTTASEGSAFLTADCSALFYDNSNAGVVNRAR